MTALKTFFKQILWWEYLYLAAYFLLALMLGVHFGSGVIIILNAIFAVTTNFLIAKGMVFGNVFGILNAVFYATNCFNNRFYGEILCLALITVPSYLISLYTWMKTKKKGSLVLSVNKRMSKQVWIVSILVSMCLGVGIYFLLGAFDTANLIVSTIATTVGLFAGFLIIQRCELNFAFYIICNITNIVLWISSFTSNNLENLPIVCAYFMFVITNTFGIFNWLKIKRMQEVDVDRKMLEICRTDLK